MVVPSQWRLHIEAWRRNGLSQTEHCSQQINVRTFTARLSDYRKLPATVSSELIPVQVEQAPTTAIVFAHAQGHRLELQASVSARWVAELMRCLA